LKIFISQGDVATLLRRGGINHFIANVSTECDRERV